MRTAVILVVGKLMPLVWLILIGLPAVRWERVLSTTTPDTANLGAAALLLLFAYAGFENTAAPAGEFKQPQRDVPFALLVMIAVVTLTYTLIQVVAVGVVPNLAGSQTPLADAGGLLAGQAGVWLLTIGALVSILGTNNNTVLAGSRYLFALAVSGYLPRKLARISPRFRTPWVALTLQTTLALPLALTGTFTVWPHCRSSPGSRPTSERPRRFRSCGVRCRRPRALSDCLADRRSRSQRSLSVCGC